jgi:hypothetical protein
MVRKGWLACYIFLPAVKFNPEKDWLIYVLNFLRRFSSESVGSDSENETDLVTTDVSVEWIWVRIRSGRFIRLVNTPASYSGGTWLKFRSGDRLSWEMDFVVYVSPPSECRNISLKLGEDRFPPNPFHFIIHVPPFHSTLYILSYWKTSLNKVQINK